MWEDQAPEQATVAAIRSAEYVLIRVSGVDGFSAAFVGAGFGALLLESFVPLGSIDPEAPIPISEEAEPATVQQVIPGRQAALLA
jgi:hypothetical protein